MQLNLPVFLNVTNGVPQGSVRGPILFTIYVNRVAQNLDASVRFYADDTIIYCCARTIDMVFKQLHLAFDSIQCQLGQLRLSHAVLKQKEGAGSTSFSICSSHFY